MTNRDRIEAGFAQIRSNRFLHTHLDDARDPDFWRALNPQLTISERPLARRRTQRPVDPAIIERAKHSLLEEGYLQTPPLIAAPELQPLKSGLERVAAAGFPSVLACVYDEFFQIFQGLDALWAPLLGEQYVFGLFGLWAYFVPSGDSAYHLWSGAAPHRDVLGPDPDVMAGKLPSIVNVWIPLTDVTPLHSCIYIVPAGCDPDFRTVERVVRLDRIRVQDIRALPAQAGSILAWSTHALHWGSRSSPQADGPREAAAVCLQRGDVPPYHPFTVDADSRMTFAERLEWIDGSLALDGLLARS